MRADEVIYELSAGGERFDVIMESVGGSCEAMRALPAARRPRR
jgi:hypothetical protein